MSARADRVNFVVETDSSLISVRESKLVDQASGSGSSQTERRGASLVAASRTRRKMAPGSHGGVTKRCAEPVRGKMSLGGRSR